MAVRFDGGDSHSEQAEGLAPVIPMFADAQLASAGDGAESDDVRHADTAGAAQLDSDGAREVLLRKLRRRSLSVREARDALRVAGAAPDAADAVVEEFVAHKWLDDTALAEQLVHAATTRKGQGRRAIARSLQTRGVPRAVVDDALDALPDDDQERALDFAHTKARAMARLEPDTALRRLVGQLARRGFPGSVAMSAARTALEDARREEDGGGVRFR